MDKIIDSFLKNVKISTKIISIVLASLMIMLIFVSVINYREKMKEDAEYIYNLESKIKLVVEPEIRKGVRNCIKVIIEPIEVSWREFLKDTEYVIGSLKAKNIQTKLGSPAFE